jgi:DNA-directed RNA polymerase subunit RPC12/RpoP
LDQIEKEMKEWMEDYCYSDSLLEDHVRTILKKDKELIRKIRKEFTEGNSQSIKKLIVDYIEKQNMFFYSCDNCFTVNLIEKEQTLLVSCIKCSSKLITTKNQNDVDRGDRKKCMYCSNPVSSYSNMTCHNCKNPTFRY